MSIILTIIGIILFLGGIIAGCSLKQYEIEEKGNEKAKFPKGFVVVILVGLKHQREQHCIMMASQLHTRSTRKCPHGFMPTSATIRKTL